MADPEGFAGMGCHEALLHGNDIAQGFGLALDPPRDVCRRVLARIFPRPPPTWPNPTRGLRCSGPATASKSPAVPSSPAGAPTPLPAPADTVTG